MRDLSTPLVVRRLFLCFFFFVICFHSSCLLCPNLLISAICPLFQVESYCKTIDASLVVCFISSFIVVVGWLGLLFVFRRLGFFLNHGSNLRFIEQDSLAQLLWWLAITNCSKIENLSSRLASVIHYQVLHHQTCLDICE